MENAVTESDRLSGIDENVCILHDNTQNMFLGIDKKYETLSIHDKQNSAFWWEMERQGCRENHSSCTISKNHGDGSNHVPSLLARWLCRSCVQKCKRLLDFTPNCAVLDIGPFENWTILKLDVFVWISNVFWQNGDHFSRFLMVGLPDFISHSKSRSFTDQPFFDHITTIPAHCIYHMPFHLCEIISLYLHW